MKTLLVLVDNRVCRTFLFLCLIMAAPRSTNAQPLNDQFADRIYISGTNIAVDASLSGATFEPGEPILKGLSSGQTTWWTWPAPADGLVQLECGGTATFHPLVAVYTGESLTELSLVASNSYVSSYQYCGSHLRVRKGTSFHVLGGQSYHIGVDSALVTTATWPLITPSPGVVWTTNILMGGQCYFLLRFTPAPKNDQFSNRITLKRSLVALPASNVGARKEPGEPDHLANPGGSSVWFSWTAPASGRITVSDTEILPYLPPSWSGSYGSIISNPGFDGCGAESDLDPPPVFFPVFAAYTGHAVDNLAPVNCLRLNLPDHTNAVAFDVTKGVTYQIAYDGNMGASGDITLHLLLTKPALNDNFEKRIRLQGIYLNAYGHNAGATHETAEPEPGAGSIGKTVWWSWLAPVNGPVALSLAGSDYAFPVAVFEGNTLSSLNQVAAGAGSVSFMATQGRFYQFCISDAQGLTGEIQMNLQAPVVQAPLLRRINLSRMFLLCFKASRGQVLLLQKSSNAHDWRTVDKVTCRQSPAVFRARASSAHSPVFYRAIIVDMVSLF